MTASLVPTITEAATSSSVSGTSIGSMKPFAMVPAVRRTLQKRLWLPWARAIFSRASASSLAT